MKWLFLLLLPFVLCANEPFFTYFAPPEGWLMTDPSKYEKGVKVGFVASKRRLFTPAITLTLEKVGKVDLATYLQSVEKLNSSNKYLELGTIETKSGKGCLIQIDIKNQWGEIRVLQSIVIHEGYAIILAASILKKDFLTVHESLLKAFKSLTTTPNLLASCNDTGLKERVSGLHKCWNKLRKTSHKDRPTVFASSFFQTNQWKPFVKYVEDELESQGNCWQLLAIKHVQETLMMENE